LRESGLFFFPSFLPHSFWAVRCNGTRRVLTGPYPDRADRTNLAPISTSPVQTLYLPGNVSVREVFRSRFGDDLQVHERLFALVNQGPLLVNYMGHGSIEVWRGSLLDTGDDGEFTNGTHLPLFVNMTCLNGYFQAPNADSLAKSLLNAKKGGALAVWASSGLTEPEGQTAINQELIRLLFDGESLTLGEAAVRAKAATNDTDVRKTWFLFGDPATRLKY